MGTHDSTGHDRPARSDDPFPECPTCGDPVLRVVTHGPGDHTAVPCCCTLADGRAVGSPTGGDGES